MGLKISRTFRVRHEVSQGSHNYHMYELFLLRPITDVRNLNLNVTAYERCCPLSSASHRGIRWREAEVSPLLPTPSSSDAASLHP